MKKLTSIFALVLCVMMLAGIVCAAADTTTPSVQAKEAPEVEKVVIVDKSGNETEIHDYSIDVTSYAAAKTDATVPAEVKTQVEDAYKEITSTTNLGTLNKDLDKAAKEINSGYTANVFVVSDLFDVTVGEDIKTALKNGGSVEITFDTNYTEKPVVLHRMENGKWEVIDSSKVVLKDGKVTVTFTSLSPIAFLSVSEDKAAETPATKSTTWIWIVVIIVVVLVIVLIVLLKGKKKDDGEAEEAPAEEAAEEAPAEEAPAEETTEEAPAEEATEEAPAEETKTEE